MAGLVLAAALAYRLPPVHNRLAWRIDNWRARVKYAISPPEQAVFQPQQQNEPTIAAMVSATLAALTPDATATPTPLLETATPLPTATPTLTPTPTITPTPLPPSVNLRGVRHEYQRWNNCGPATLSMALSFYGWMKGQTVAADFLKPNQRDKNVSPYEMVNFVNGQTDLRLLWRQGGDTNLLKHLLASGYPVIVEKGFSGSGFDGWMGHYELLTGYDDAQGIFIAQDSYRGPDYAVPYDTLMQEWRAFNYIFLLPYPPEREAEVLTLLGAWADEEWANRHALQIAEQESQTLDGQALFFAWFNIGTSHVRLREYQDAAVAYDFAFSLYAALPEEKRPWRMMWYQTGPYWAYYYSGRYQDVINLATTTLSAMSEPILEESYYWRALARDALGDRQGALDDLRESVRLNPNFTPGWAMLEQLSP